MFPARVHIDGESLWPSRSPFCGTWRSGSAEVSALRSGHLEQSSRPFAVVLHLQRTAPAWIEDPALPAGLLPLRTLCWRMCRTELDWTTLWSRSPPRLVGLGVETHIWASRPRRVKNFTYLRPNSITLSWSQTGSKPNCITLSWSQTGPRLVADLSQTC